MRLKISRLLLLLPLLLFSLGCPNETEAQTATVTATVTDTAAQAFSNGTYRIEFRPTPGKDISQFTNSGAAFTKLFTGTLDGNGTFIQAGVTRNDFIQPGLSQWTFTVCPNASSACVSAGVSITTASPNLSSTLSNLTTIQTFAMPTPYTYTDAEVKATPNPGQIYYNTLNKSHRFWDGSTWNPFNSGTKAITTCTGLVGDGVTSDVVAINACINANQGRHIILPKTQAIGACDYNINGGTVLLKGHGQIFEGEGAGWGGAGSNTTLCKTVEDGLPGFDIIHANCQNCTIKNIHITGPSSWTSSTLTQNIPPCSPPEGITYAAGVTCITGGDGIKVEAGFTTLENVYVENWGHNGIYTTSEFGGFPDNFHFINVTSNNNRGDGYYCKGGDCNAGSTLQYHAYNNQMYGLDEHSFLGNSHYSPQMTGNHFAGTTTGGTFASTATRTSNVVTLTATGHNFAVGNVIVVTGMSDSTFNGTFSISAVATNTVTYPQTAADSTATGGTSRLTSNNEYYAFTLLTGGAYNNVGASAWNTYYSPYCEGSQNPFISRNHTLIIGGDEGCGIDYTNNPLVIGNEVNNSGFSAANFLTGSAGFYFVGYADTGSSLNIGAGKTLDATTDLRFVGGHSANVFWDWVMNPGSTNNETLALWRKGNGQKQRLAFYGFGANGPTDIQDEGTATRFHNAGDSNESGTTEFYTGGASPVLGSRLDNLGKFTTYNKQTTASVGVPFLPASVDSTGNTAAIGTTNLLANAPIGFYKIHVTAASTTTCATPGPAQAVVSLSWTSENAVETSTPAPTISLGANTAGHVLGSDITIWVNSISNITYSVAYTACTSGTGTYNLRLRLIRE